MIVERNNPPKFVGFEFAEISKQYINIDKIYRLYKTMLLDSSIVYKLETINGDSFEISESCFCEILDLVGVIK